MTLIERIRTYFNPGWAVAASPELPMRVVKCIACGGDINTREEGERIHSVCALAQQTIKAAQAKHAAEERRQIDLIKKAILELKSEGNL